MANSNGLLHPLHQRHGKRVVERDRRAHDGPKLLEVSGQHLPGKILLRGFFPPQQMALPPSDELGASSAIIGSV